MQDTQVDGLITTEFTGKRFKIIYHSRISSVGTALDCRAGG